MLCAQTCSGALASCGPGSVLARWADGSGIEMWPGADSARCTISGENPVWAALLAALVLAANNLGKTVDDVREKRAEYCSLDATFEETREDNLIVGCTDAIDEGDLEAFATACNEFDEITKLDS